MIDSYTPGSRQVFVGIRQRLVNSIGFAIMGGFFIFLTFSVWTGSPGSRSSAATFLVPTIVLFAAVFIRSFRASTVEIEGDKLVYRSLLINRTFRRVDIVRCEVRKKIRGAGQVWMLGLVTKKGSTVWLSELNEGLRGSIGVEDSYNERLHRLEDAVNLWLSEE